MCGVGIGFKGTQRTFWSDANILFIDWDAGYVGLYICQKPLPGQLKYVNLIVNKLYP